MNNKQNEGDGVALVRDPSLVKNRIFIGNLPVCTRTELEGICERYGNVLGTLVQKNFGFVQFESEEIANKAAQALNGSIFKGNRVTVRNAGAGKGKPKQQKLGRDGSMDVAMPSQAESIQTLQQMYHSQLASDYNDCEIIVVSKQYTEYAEYIEQRLKRLYLKVDLLFPNEDVPIGKVLANISSRGCLYAILISAQNGEHRSITVNILYGQPAEHRNMPVEDAINLISNDFQSKLREERKKVMVPSAVPICANFVAPPLKERHPDPIQNLLNLLADNMPLTVLQYDRIINYLQERRELQVTAELGENIDYAPPPKQMAAPPDPEIELQKKILSILNKSSITEPKSDLVYPTVQSLQRDPETIELLKDNKVQKALDSLMKTGLVETIENHFNF